MTAARGPVRRLIRRLMIFSRRVLNRLRFFPFTLGLVLLDAGLNLVQLRRRVVVVRVGEVMAPARHLPRNAMLWVDRWVFDLRREPQPCDACFLLPRDSDRADLHDMFSAMLAFPRFRSLAFYWDGAALQDDLPLWGRPVLLQASPQASFDDLTRLPVTRLDEFIRAEHTELALPVAVTRDAQNFLKRHARAAPAVILHLPAKLAALADDIATRRPDMYFIDLASHSGARSANCLPMFEHGMTLHERMALVQAADAYIGRFDEVGCAAIITGRAALLLDGGDATVPRDIVRAKNVVCLPEPLVATAALAEALQFVFASIEAKGGSA